jgi:hypothetical protein
MPNESNGKKRKEKKGKKKGKGQIPWFDRNPKKARSKTPLGKFKRAMGIYLCFQSFSVR